MWLWLHFAFNVYVQVQTKILAGCWNPGWVCYFSVVSRNTSRNLHECMDVFRTTGPCLGRGWCGRQGPPLHASPTNPQWPGVRRFVRKYELWTGPRHVNIHLYVNLTIIRGSAIEFCFAANPWMFNSQMCCIQFLAESFPNYRSS